MQKVTSPEKHVHSHPCQQNGTIYEVIFFVNECLNKLQLPRAPILWPVFNIPRAVFETVLSVLVTHCLEIGNVYISLRFAGRGERWWSGSLAKSVFQCVAEARPWLHLWGQSIRPQGLEVCPGGATLRVSQ